MKFGAHVSAAGGLWNAPENAAAIGCETFQFFSRPPQGGAAPRLDKETVGAFRKACEKNGFEVCVIHAPYILNFASASARILERSVQLVREELERGTALGVAYVMFHPGSAKDVGDEQALKMVASGIRTVLKGYEGSCRLLVEISAGAGNVIGDTFDEVGEILRLVGDDSVGVCFDTAHAFAAGYDLRTAAAVKETFTEFDRRVGLDRLMMSHLNDSKVELGGKKDRHEHVGSGHIGLDGFKAMFSDERLEKLLWILETPFDGQADDLKTIRKILKVAHA